MHITVYLDRLKGTNPALVHTLHELGTWMGQKGHTLIYDSTKTGLTEELVADVLAAGGTVIDIASQFSTDAAPQDSSAHKERIIEVGGAFIAFPGGTGTLEEISEVMSLSSLKLTKAPCILYNLNGYYEPLRLQLQRMVEAGLSSPERQEGIHFASDLREIQNILEKNSKNC